MIEKVLRPFGGLFGWITWRSRPGSNDKNWRSGKFFLFPQPEMGQSSE